MCTESIAAAYVKKLQTKQTVRRFQMTVIIKDFNKIILWGCNIFKLMFVFYVSADEFPNTTYSMAWKIMVSLVCHYAE